jgi:adenylosuccinate lyase
LRLDGAALQEAMGEPMSFVGNAPAQVEAFVARVEELVRRHPAAAAYSGEDIL